MSIFKFLNSEEYKHMLDVIRHCILSTDLELYFQHNKQLTELLSSDSFNWAEPEHRYNYKNKIKRLDFTIAQRYTGILETFDQFNLI